MKDTITSRGVTFRRPVADEKTEQGSIVNFTEQIQGKPYVLGFAPRHVLWRLRLSDTDPSTRQTEGVGDLAIYLPPPPRLPSDQPWRLVWIECKGRRGELSPAQVVFRQLNQAAGVHHLVGGIDEYLAYLQAGGWVRGGPR